MAPQHAHYRSFLGNRPQSPVEERNRRGVAQALGEAGFRRGWAANRASRFGGDFVARAAGIGSTTILAPVRAPNANAIAERVIGIPG